MDNLAEKFTYKNRNLEKEPISHMSNMSHTSGILSTLPSPLYIGIPNTSKPTTNASTDTYTATVHLPCPTQHTRHITHQDKQPHYQFIMIHTKSITLMTLLRKLSWMSLSLMIDLIQLFFRLVGCNR